MTTVFGAVADMVGIDKSVELMETLGGQVFYIPIRPARLIRIKAMVEHKRLIGRSEAQIVEELVIYLGFKKKTVKKTIKKAETYQQGGLFD